jgi:hypothetical protein
MRSPEFWNYFDRVAAPRLDLRAQTFARIFEYLDQFDRPVGIVETGCVRQKDNWAGDGQSTVLFDKYAEFHGMSVVFSVDCDPDAVAVCQSMVSDRVRIHSGESVAYLKSLTDHPPPGLEFVDLLYLDSYDVDLEDPLPSAIHHLKELAAISPMISSKTLVVIDDSPFSLVGVPDGNGSIKLIRPPKIGGKGQLIAEYAIQIEAEVVFTGYQCGWVGFGRPSSDATARPCGTTVSDPGG